MRKCKHFIFAVLVLIPTLSLAQDAPQRDPQAIALLVRAHATMGGPTLAAVADTRAEITMRSEGEEGFTEQSAVHKTMGRKAWRTEGTGPAGAGATVVNDGWGSSDSGGDSQGFPTVAVAEAGNWRIPWLTIMTEWEDPEIEVTYVGTENDGNIHRVRMHRKTKDAALAEVWKPCDVFLDAQSGLPVKLTYSAHPPENLLVSIPIEVEYSDYRLFSGLLVPTRIKYSIRGRLVSEILVSRFLVNTGASASEFQVR